MISVDGRPELLAPAGTLEAVHVVLEAGADAVYVGGKRFNMRMHRPSYNLDDAEVAAAIQAAHEQGKKVYYTLNNLVYDSELAEVREVLEMLGELTPDAIIVQDIGVAALAREICVHIPLHASTMMNIHNAAAATSLKLMGFTRVIASRDIPLDEIRRIGTEAGIEMECFIHGDMCAAQSSLCYLSATAFGESPNRGRCMKPCRWCWELVPADADAAAPPAKGFLLGRKDLCLYQQVPALVDSGVDCLKIEGRMRTAEFLARIVAAYRVALDAYAADPYQYRTDPEAMRELWARRARDFSTCHTFGPQGARAVDLSGKREPRLFSQYAPTPVLSPAAPFSMPPSAKLPELIVRVADRESAEAAASEADAIYLGSDARLDDASRIEPEWVMDFARRMRAAGKRAGVLTPRITEGRDVGELAWWLGQLAPAADALTVGVSNLGALALARDAGFSDILADFSINVTNSVAADELSTMGIARVTASIELSFDPLRDLLEHCRLPVEVVGQGPLPGMLLEDCLIAAAHGGTRDGVCTMDCLGGRFFLRDAHGQEYRVEADRRCRNHLYASADVCVLPNLGRLVSAGIDGLRIEGQLESPAVVAEVVRVYRQVLDGLAEARPYDTTAAAAHIGDSVGRPLSDGAFAFAKSGWPGTG